MRSGKTLILAAITTMSMTSVLAEDRGERGGQRRGPPPVAIEACSNSTDGQVCSFEGRRGDVVEGVCVTTPKDILACRPDKPRRGRRSRRDGETDSPSEG